MKINEYNYDEIKVGDMFEFKRNLSIEDVDNYAKLTEDFNPFIVMKNMQRVHNLNQGSCMACL